MGAEGEQEKEMKKNGDDVSIVRGTAITEAQFHAWKQRKDADLVAMKAEADRKRAEDIASGSVQMNGRELFIHEPWVFDNNQY